MSTTLEAELLQAADEIDRLCTCNFISCPNKERCARLRARAAWVLELAVERHVSPALFDALTGPIPASETATTERTP